METIITYNKEDGIEALVYDLNGVLVDYYDPILSIQKFDNIIYIDNGYYIHDLYDVSKVLVRERDSAEDLYGWGSLTGEEYCVYEKGVT